MTDRDRLTEIEAANNTFIGPGYDGTGAQQLVSDIAWLISRVRELEATVQDAKDHCKEANLAVHAQRQQIAALEAELEESIVHGNKMTDFYNIWKDKCAGLEADRALLQAQYRDLNRLYHERGAWMSGSIAELEADKARLDWLMSSTVHVPTNRGGKWPSVVWMTREWIDAAMPVANGSSRE